MKQTQTHKINIEINSEQVTEILNNKIFPRPQNFNTFDVLTTGLYTLGLIKNNSRYVTIDEQIRRATELAEFLLNKFASSETNDEKIEICIVGAGLSGIACALKLLENTNLAITLLEKRHMLCPIQRNCQIRKVYPRLHEWPQIDMSLSHSIDISDDLRFDTGDSVGHIAAKCVRKIIQKSRENDNFKILQDVGYLHISKFSEGSTNICVHASGKKLDRQGRMQPMSINRQFDVCILATGFGIEANNSDFKQANKISYWRNDDRSQVPLYSKNSNYLISGYGDGALNDLFRLKIYDYDAVHFLKEFEKCSKKIMNTSEVSKILQIDKWDNGSLDIFEILEGFFNNISNQQPELQDLAGWIRDDTVVILHLRRIDAVATTIGYHRDSSTQAIKRILNNPNSLKYNKFIFYLLWKFHGFKIEINDSLEELVATYKIPEENVLIRHGSDKLSSVRDILSPSLFEITSQLINQSANDVSSILKVA